jgi:hypothetical protein
MLSPGDIGWDRLIAGSHRRIALLRLRQTDRTRALEELTAGRALLAPYSGMPGFADDLAWFDAEIARLRQ